MDWFPWYFTLYEEATMHLDPYQDGCYRRLIDHYMKTRTPLPDNDQALARIVGDSFENWTQKAAPVVRQFFPSKGGKLFNNRCEIELERQDNLTKKLSESGKKGQEARKKLQAKNNGLVSPPEAPPSTPAEAQDRTGQLQDRIIPDIHPSQKTDIVGGDLFGAAKKTKPEKIKAHRLPDDWAPDIDLGEWAMARGLTRAEVLTEIEAFKNHWKASAGKSSVKLDWDAAFRTWAINAVKFKTERKKTR